MNKTTEPKPPRRLWLAWKSKGKRPKVCPECKQRHTVQDGCEEGEGGE